MLPTPNDNPDFVPEPLGGHITDPKGSKTTQNIIKTVMPAGVGKLRPTNTLVLSSRLSKLLTRSWQMRTVVWTLEKMSIWGW